MKLSQFLKECGIEEKSAFRLDNNYGTADDYARAKERCSGYNQALKEIGDLEIEINELNALLEIGGVHSGNLDEAKKIIKALSTSNIIILQNGKK
jgi:hypothetical protein